MLWVLTVVFSVLQTLQVVLYGQVFERTGNPRFTTEYFLNLFSNPVFLAAVFALSVGTALLRFWLFPQVGIARTHVITSVSFVFSFIVFVAVFRENLSPHHYVGTLLVAAGVYLVSK
jgi:drug/metabolite transporter (DMT)-like permease